MEKQKKSIGTIALVVLLLVVTVVSLILATYAWAKYQSVGTETAGATVAKWNVSFSESGNFSTHFTHVVDTKIAPGTSGQFTVSVNPGITETDFYYVIYINSVANKPAHLKFYTTAAHTAGTELSTNVTTPDLAEATASASATSGGYIYGTYTGSATTGSAIDHVIYWDWPYEDPTNAGTDTDEDGITDYDEQDVTDSALGNMTVTVKATAIQMQPTVPTP